MSIEQLIIIGISAMLLMAFAVVLFVVLYQRRVILHQLELKTINEQKQLELQQASFRGEEEERMRIAGELHDDVGATLSSVRLFLHKAEESAPGSEMLQQSRLLVDDSIRKIRDISQKLQPAMLKTLGLDASLQSFVATINRTGQLQITYSSDTRMPRLSDAAELHAYRILQELLNNTAKHSGATQVALRAWTENAQWVIALTHDGQGLTEERFQTGLQQKDGTGLKNIANRLRFINAHISFPQRAGDSLIIRIPTLS